MENAKGFKFTKKGLIIIGVIAAVVIAAITAIILIVNGSEEHTPTPEPTPEHVHSWCEWETVTEPTCISDGLQERACTCGEKEIQSTSALGHTYGYEQDATCNVCEYERTIMVAGLYDENDNLIADWETLGINVEINYTYSNYNNSRISPFYVLYNQYSNPAYRAGIKLIIPESVTSIGNYAFCHCSGLTSIVIPDSVTSIGDYAFSCCKIANIIIPESVTSIGSHAFDVCYITSIVIPDSVTSIGDYAFRECSSLASVVIPNSVTSIGDYAFISCSSLTSIDIPDSVTSIGDYTFYDCSSLASVVIGDSVTSIGDRAFYNCSSLTSIVIPDSVTSIGDLSFVNCSSLTSIEFGGTKAQWDAISKGLNWDYGTGNYTIYCADGTISK